MEDNTNGEADDIKPDIKKESKNDESNANENSNLGTIVHEIKIKNEPMDEQASCSSIKIINSFSIPSVSENTSAINTNNNSVFIVPNQCFDSNASGSKCTVKSEKEDTLIEPKVENEANLNQTVVKKENENSTVEPSDSSIAIASILTTPAPSTSVPYSSSTSNDDQTNDVTSSTDQKPICRYGRSCYRLSKLHRKNFFHPPGNDPSKSPEKPRCKYGSRCYRKSELHRKRFIHDRSPDNAMSRTRKRKVKDASSQTASQFYESDFEDSYLNEDSYDGSSDEFNPSDDDFDSDETDFDIDSDEELPNYD